MNDDFIPWLHQQLDADERIAKRVEPNQAPNELRAMVTRDGSPPFLIIDSARALAEVDADRRILREYERLRLRDPLRVGPYWDGVRDAWESVVRLRAESYASRPGYQESWRP